MAAQIAPAGAAIRAHEELFAYWSSLRADAGVPPRGRLDPGDIKRLLPTVSLIEVLQADENLLRASDTKAQAQTESARAAVAAIKALGGGWDAALSVAAN